MLSEFPQVDQARNGKPLDYGHFSAFNSHFLGQKQTDLFQIDSIVVLALDLMNNTERMKILS